MEPNAYLTFQHLPFETLSPRWCGPKGGRPNHFYFSFDGDFNESVFSFTKIEKVTPFNFMGKFVSIAFAPCDGKVVMVYLTEGIAVLMLSTVDIDSVCFCVRILLLFHHSVIKLNRNYQPIEAKLLKWHLFQVSKKKRVFNCAKDWKGHKFKRFF